MKKQADMELGEQPAKEIILAPSQEVATITPMQLLQQALEKGIDTDQLTKLVELQERWEDRQARKEFVTAMAAFKAEPLKIVKNQSVSYPSQKGGLVEYDHATLDMVVDVIAPALSAHGLSHAWRTEQGDKIRVTCIITHVMGHSEEVWLEGELDSTGGKNDIQGVGSTVTYLERYTLLAALGLATKGQDIDAVNVEVGPISDEQFKELTSIIDETNADIVKLCEHFKIMAVRELPAARFKEAMTLLNAKKGKQQ